MTGTNQSQGHHLIATWKTHKAKWQFVPLNGYTHCQSYKAEFAHRILENKWIFASNGDAVCLGKITSHLKILHGLFHQPTQQHFKMLVPNWKVISLIFHHVFAEKAKNRITYYTRKPIIECILIALKSREKRQ